MTPATTARPARRILCALFVLLALLSQGPARAETTTVKVVKSAYVHETVPAPDIPACARVDDAYFDGAVFVGDSLADGLGIHNLLPEIQLMTRIGLSPRTAAGEKLFKHNDKPVTLATKLPKMRPTVVYLWLGSNGLDVRDADQVIRDYERLLRRILTALPDVPVCLLEVTPVAADRPERYEHFTNARVDAFNAGLYALARRHNVYLLPVNALLKDEAGNLPADYAAEDGIHLQKAAYELLAEYLYTHVVPIVPDEAAP